MKKRNMLFISILAAAWMFYTPLKAQGKKEICPSPKIKKGYFEKLQQMRSRPQQRSQAATNEIRIFFHIVTDDNGSYAGAMPADLDAEIADMRSDFAPGNICFVFADFNYVASTTLNHINVVDNDDADDLFKERSIPGCINIFYTYEIKGKNGNNGGTIGGITFDLPGTVCLVRKSGIGRHTASHETGHCLGLLHTYETRYGEEYIDGTLCGINGDLMCDTHADPYSHYDESCFSIDDDTNEYTGVCEDPAGSKNFAPPYHNLMSYWHHSPQSFTGDQFDAMNDVIDDDDDIAATASASTVTLNGVSHNFGFYYKSARETVTSIGDTKFSNGIQAGLYGKSIQLLPGFSARSEISYVLLRATNCNASGARISTNTMIASQEIKPALKNIEDNKLTVFPNPTNNYCNIQYSEKQLFDATINIRNINGAIIYTTMKTNITQLQEKINLTGKPKGIYLIELITKSKRLTNKIIVQ